MIPYGRQEITQEDIDSVVDVLESDFLTQGPKVPEFENSIKEHCGVTHALAVSNATAALHVACLALGVGPGDEVWTGYVRRWHPEWLLASSVSGPVKNCMR